MSSSEGEIVLYQPDDTITLEVQMHDETVWLSQQQMAQLFNVKVPAVSKHIKNIYEEGELQRNPTISIMETVRVSKIWDIHSQLPSSQDLLYTMYFQNLNKQK